MDSTGQNRTTLDMSFHLQPGTTYYRSFLCGNKRRIPSLINLLNPPSPSVAIIDTLVPVRHVVLLCVVVVVVVVEVLVRGS